MRFWQIDLISFLTQKLFIDYQILYINRIVQGIIPYCDINQSFLMQVSKWENARFLHICNP